MQQQQASLPQGTSSRKEKRELLKGMQRVTTDKLNKHCCYLFLTTDTSHPEGFHTHLGLH
jgi:hypothetical protein